MAKKKAQPRNTVASAMMKRYGTTTTTHADRREKRRDRNSWRRDERLAEGS